MVYKIFLTGRMGGMKLKFAQFYESTRKFLILF